MDKPVGRNWWKIGFFVLLFLLEVAREIIVIANTAEAEPYVRKDLLLYDGYAGVSGVWKRTDGGDPLVKTVANIQCYRDRGECYEAAYRLEGLNSTEPSLNIFPATFTAEAISFDDASSICMTYSTRIDLKSEKVTRIRVKKPLTGKEVGMTPDLMEVCEGNEARIEMELSEYKTADRFKDPSKDHFLPIYSLVRWALCES
jgi:hypothetical protein